jgi:hypothetical protein
MNPEYADIELIEKYLEGKLTADEVLNFEKRLNEDPSFVLQFEAQKISNTLLEDYEMLQLKKQMQLEMPKSSGGNTNYLLYVGASLLIGLASYFTLNDYNNKKSEDPVSIKKEENKVEKNIPLNSTIDSNTKNIHTNDFKTTEKINNDKNTFINNEKEKINTPAIIPEQNKNIYTGNIKNIVTVKDSFPKQKDCAGFVIEHTIEKENTCEGKNKGSIKVTVIKGGSAPYKFSISSKQGFNTSGKFSFLSTGEYYLNIKENEGCVFQIKEPVKIEAKSCYEPFNMTFNPYQEGVWKLPIEAGQSGKIKFQNKAGLLVHEIAVQNGQPSEWDGINFRGEETPAGYYYITIEKTDGTIEYGYLTINR